jgi:hypothetical protein
MRADPEEAVPVLTKATLPALKKAAAKRRSGQSGASVTASIKMVIAKLQRAP